MALGSWPIKPKKKKKKRKKRNYFKANSNERKIPYLYIYHIYLDIYLSR